MSPKNVDDYTAATEKLVEIRTGKLGIRTPRMLLGLDCAL